MNIDKILKNYGLTDKQTKVYLASLQLGSSPVQKIANKAGLARSTVYEVLESLKQKGFVSTFMKKKVRYFSAEDPDQIVKLAEMKTEALKNVLPELNALVGDSRKRPTVRFYQRKQGMKMILEEVLVEADEFLSFGYADELFRELGDYFNEFVKRRAKNKIPVRVILKESEKAYERKRLGPQHLRKVKIVPATYTFHGHIFIWKNKVAMFSFVKDFEAIVVESQELADIQRGMFNHLWDLAE